MAKLSHIVQRLQSYIDLHGDKDVTSIGSVCGDRNVEYTLNVHDIYDGSKGSNPYSGADKIEIYKTGKEITDSGSSTKAKTLDEDARAQALYNLRKMEQELSKQEDSSAYTRMIMFWGAVDAMKHMGVANEGDLNRMWNEFALKQLNVK